MGYEQYIGARGQGKPYLINGNGDTADIIGAIIDADKHAAAYVKNLAPVLRGHSDIATCHNLWTFWKQHVRYKEDPDGVQYIKSPRELFHSGEGDCKSYSIAVAACLKMLGIPYVYRFTSETPGKDFHHVYIVARTKQGDVIIDCVLDKFDYQNPFVTKKDIAPAKGKIGATQAELTAQSWAAYEADYKNNFSKIKEDVRQRCLNGIGFYWNNKPVIKGKVKELFTQKYPGILLMSQTMAYRYWDAAKYGEFPHELNQKRNTGEQIYNQIKKMGVRETDIRDICAIGVYNTYGITLDYLLYRCGNMIKYGQPWAPAPGVPYYNFATKTFVNTDNTAAGLEKTVKIAMCFPAGGGVTRPFGQPYWAVGGYIMPNGATDAELSKWKFYNPKPATGIANNGAGVSSAFFAECQALYVQWVNGNMPALPTIIPTTGNNSGKPKIGAGGLESTVIVAIIGAILTAISTIVGILKAVGVLDPNAVANLPANVVPNPPADFNLEYTAANGCFIGTAPNECGSNKAMYCPNGTFTCLNAQQLASDPALQPAMPANGFGGAGGTGWLFMAAAALIFIGLFTGGGSKNNA